MNTNEIEVEGAESKAQSEGISERPLVAPTVEAAVRAKEGVPTAAVSEPSPLLKAMYHWVLSRF